MVVLLGCWEVEAVAVPVPPSVEGEGVGMTERVGESQEGEAEGGLESVVLREGEGVEERVPNALTRTTFSPSFTNRLSQLQPATGSNNTSIREPRTRGEERTADIVTILPGLGLGIHGVELKGGTAPNGALVVRTTTETSRALGSPSPLLEERARRETATPSPQLQREARERLTVDPRGRVWGSV